MEHDGSMKEFLKLPDVNQHLTKVTYFQTSIYGEK